MRGWTGWPGKNRNVLPGPILDILGGNNEFLRDDRWPVINIIASVFRRRLFSSTSKGRTTSEEQEAKRSDEKKIEQKSPTVNKIKK